MRYAFVTETYPPEINGVALTVQGLEHGLLERGHDVTLIRPRQREDALQTARSLLVRGASPVSYTHLDVYKRQANDRSGTGGAAIVHWRGHAASW